MKIIDLIQKHSPVDLNISGKDLQKLHLELLQCDEFSDSKNLIIVDFPNFLMGDIAYSVSTKNMPKNFKFSGITVLYSIMLSPEIYDPSLPEEIIGGVGCITPTIYNQHNYEPKRYIKLEFSPDNVGDENVKQKLHNDLDLILNNPDHYRIKGERSLILRLANLQ